MQNRLQLRMQYIAIIPITSVITCRVHSRVKSMHFLPDLGFWNKYDETHLLWESATANSFTTSSPSLPSNRWNQSQWVSLQTDSCGCTHHLFKLAAVHVTQAGNSRTSAEHPHRLHTVEALSSMFKLDEWCHVQPLNPVTGIDAAVMSADFWS